MQYNFTYSNAKVHTVTQNFTYSNAKAEQQ